MILPASYTTSINHSQHQMNITWFSHLITRSKAYTFTLQTAGLVGRTYLHVHAHVGSTGTKIPPLIQLSVSSVHSNWDLATNCHKEINLLLKWSHPVQPPHTLSSNTYTSHTLNIHSGTEHSYAVLYCTIQNMDKYYIYVPLWTDVYTLQCTYIKAVCGSLLSVNAECMYYHNTTVTLHCKCM